ncbi:MAG: hypothetical protein RL748_4245 [Pseudomonadota bacterium]
MLLSYGIKNFFSFKEEADISLRLDANCPPAISQGRDTTPVLCIKGANASGKTQLLKALSFLGHFCSNSFANRPGQPIAIAPFFQSSEPCEMFVEFRLGELDYRYELSITQSEVIRESFYQSRAKKTKLLERSFDSISFSTRAMHALSLIKLRKNASIIDTAHQYELDELAPFYQFFSTILSNVGPTGLSEQTVSIDTISRLLVSNMAVFDFVKAFILSCDIGIADMQIVQFVNKDGSQEFFPQFIHLAEGQAHAISDVMESSGTQTLFKNLAAYKLALDSGAVLLIDEIDLNLHPHILPKLLQLFLDPQHNPNGAQLIFSTHDSEILNLLGRYRVVLVAKEDNESYAYRLDEIPGDILRNDRPIRPAYNEGKIGGVPRV